MKKNRKIWPALLGIAAAVCLLAVWVLPKSRPQQPREDLPVDKTEIIAHRGSSAEAPENSIPAFRRAIREGADWIELDVRQTRDGVAVVCHDSGLDRVAGVSKEIWQLTCEEVKNCDIGSWFSPEYRDLQVPTLEEALKLCRGKVRLNIELKPTGHEQGLEREVIGLICRNGMEEDCVVASAAQETLETVKRLEPGLKTLFVASSDSPEIWREDFADMVSMEARAVDVELVNTARKAGKKLFVWTVNDTEAMKKLMLAGADGIITDDPAEALRVRAALNRDEK